MWFFRNLYLLWQKTGWWHLFQEEMYLSLAFSVESIWYDPRERLCFLITLSLSTAAVADVILRTKEQVACKLLLGEHGIWAYFLKWWCCHVIKLQLRDEYLTLGNHLIEENGRQFIILKCIFFRVPWRCGGIFLAYKWS